MEGQAQSNTNKEDESPSSDASSHPQSRRRSKQLSISDSPSINLLSEEDEDSDTPGNNNNNNNPYNNYSDNSPYWQIDPTELSYNPNKDLIGQGKNSKVYHGIFRSQEVAIKVFKQQLDAEQFLEFQKELDILAKVRTPNLIFFYGGSLHPKPIIVTEYVA